MFLLYSRKFSELGFYGTSVNIDDVASVASVASVAASEVIRLHLPIQTLFYVFHCMPPVIVFLMSGTRYENKFW